MLHRFNSCLLCCSSADGSAGIRFVMNDSLQLIVCLGSYHVFTDNRFLWRCSFYYVSFLYGFSPNRSVICSYVCRFWYVFSYCLFGNCPVLPYSFIIWRFIQCWCYVNRGIEAQIFQGHYEFLCSFLCNWRPFSLKYIFSLISETFENASNYEVIFGVELACRLASAGLISYVVIILNWRFAGL